MARLIVKDTNKTKYLIAVSGNTIKSFSEKLDISYSYLSRVLSGNSFPSAQTAYKISRELDKELTDLFDVKDKEKVT